MNLGMMKRRFSVGEQQSDIYEGCVTLEFTETFEDKERTLLYNHNNVTLYLAALIIDGVEVPIVRGLTHVFGLGRHKVGWRFNGTIIYNYTMQAVCGNTSFSADNSFVTIPEGITEIQDGALRAKPAYRPIQGVVCHAEVPPVAMGTSIALWYLQQSEAYLYVPAGSVEAYKVAEGWSQYASQIVAIGT